MNNKNMEYTYVMIKPDISWNEVWVEQIKKMFEKNDLEIVLTYASAMNKMGYCFLSEKQLEEHYGHVKEYGEDIYEGLINFMKKGPVIPMVLKGEDAVLKVRALVGPTDSTKAPRDTIRGLFGTDKRENAIHASDSVESAKEEIIRFFGKKCLEELTKEHSKTYRLTANSKQNMYSKR